MIGPTPWLIPQPPRRTVFISYHGADRAYVDEFVRRWTDSERVFIPKMVGVGGYSQDLIDSNNSDYVIGQIRTRYIADSTVTILLIGACTHGRRYIDWELKASLRQGDTYTPNGLIGILIPEYNFHPQKLPHLPERFSANLNSRNPNAAYARYYYPPQSAAELRGWIEDAFTARTTRAQHIRNSSERMLYNGRCQVHNVTH